MEQLKNLLKTHKKMLDYTTPGPWETGENSKTGKMEVWGQKNIGGEKIFEMDVFNKQDLDFLKNAKVMLDRYHEALEFLVDCYDNAVGPSEVGVETLRHTHKILQGE